MPACAEYAAINGFRMYYEIHGSGRAVVLLHGGLNTIDTSFAKQIPALAKNHRVIAIEQMAHGRTADVAGRNLSYENMAEDTAALMGALGIASADFVGWSDGGQVALRLAFTHSGLVRRVVASGVGLGGSPELVNSFTGGRDFGKAMAEMMPEAHAAYQRLSPDGADHWAVLAEKSRAMYSRSTWGFGLADLAKIARPVLLVAGDRDMVELEDTIRIFRAIPAAELYIVPGTGHGTFQDRPEWLNTAVTSFLDRN